MAGLDSSCLWGNAASCGGSVCSLGWQGMGLIALVSECVRTVHHYAQRQCYVPSVCVL